MVLLTAFPAAEAQRTDTARVAAQQPRAARDTLGPPISPRRAFLLSLAVPGLGQAALDRGTAGAIFVATEAASIAMIRKTLHDLRLAKAAPDSIVVDYERDGSGLIVIDPQTGLPTPIYEPHLLVSRVRARRTHLEDWIVLLVFNHFFAGADAFVAAHLWEVPARVSMTAQPGGLALAVRVAW